MNFKVDSRSHFRQGWDLLLHVTFSALWPLYFHFRFGPESAEFALKAAALYLSFVGIPQVVLHLKYWHANYSAELQINGSTITYKSKRKSLTFNREDIDSVCTVVPYAMARGASLRWYPWDSYAYTKIRLKSGEDIIVTTLLLGELAWPIKFKHVAVEARFFCWPN